MSPLLVPVIVTVLCWLLSWRRTPFALGWLAISVGVGAVGVLIVGGAEAVHHTLPGLAAAVGAGCVLPIAVTACIEACALDEVGTSNSDIARWRAGHRSTRINRGRWTVITKAQRQDNGKDTVWLGVRKGDTTRWIGDADPIADMDAFMELRARADQAAETLNALKIEAS